MDTVAQIQCIEESYLPRYCLPRLEAHLGCQIMDPEASGTQNNASIAACVPG